MKGGFQGNRSCKDLARVLLPHRDPARKTQNLWARLKLFILRSPGLQPFHHISFDRTLQGRKACHCSCLLRFKGSHLLMCYNGFHLLAACNKTKPNFRSVLQIDFVTQFVSRPQKVQPGATDCIVHPRFMIACAHAARAKLPSPAIKMPLVSCLSPPGTSGLAGRTVWQHPTPCQRLQGGPIGRPTKFQKAM